MRDQTLVTCTASQGGSTKTCPRSTSAMKGQPDLSARAKICWNYSQHSVKLRNCKVRSVGWPMVRESTSSSLTLSWGNHARTSTSKWKAYGSLPARESTNRRHKSGSNHSFRPRRQYRRWIQMPFSSRITRTRRVICKLPSNFSIMASSSLKAVITAQFIRRSLKN